MIGASLRERTHKATDRTANGSATGHPHSQGGPSGLKTNAQAERAPESPKAMVSRKERVDSTLYS